MSVFEKTIEQTETQFLRSVGIQKGHFFGLLEKVEAYLQTARAQQPMKKRGKKSHLALGDRLLLTLMYLRHYPTFATLGSTFGISESYANKLYHQILDILVKVLEMKSRKQLRKSNLQTVMIDVTEQPIERPPPGQRTYYSGKKNDIP
jgi:hypothetical protein